MEMYLSKRARSSLIRDYAVLLVLLQRPTRYSHALSGNFCNDRRSRCPVACTIYCHSVFFLPLPLESDQSVYLQAFSLHPFEEGESCLCCAAEQFSRYQILLFAQIPYYSREHVHEQTCRIDCSGLAYCHAHPPHEP